MPDNEYAFGFEVVLSFDQVLCEVFAVVLHFCPQVVDHKWLGEVVFVVCKGHRLEVKSHGCAAFQITKLVATSGGVGVGVKEPGNWLAVLREIWVVKTLVPLLIEIDNVIGLWVEERSQFVVGEDSIKHPDFINCGFSTLVSDTSSNDGGEESQVNLPDQCLVKHHERETSPG